MPARTGGFNRAVIQYPGSDLPPKIVSINPCRVGHRPIIEPLGIDMIWFGVMMVICLEMGLISPPVGVNVFVVKGIAEGVPLNTIFRGIWPFWFAMLACILLLLAVPQLALILPNTMFG